MSIREDILMHVQNVGGWSISADPAMCEAMAPDYDFVTIDCEHGSASLRDVEHAIRAIECGGSVPFVRIDSPDKISRYLDAGAVGIIAPDIRNADQARAIVDRVKFPPMGGRSVSMARCTGYGRRFAEYLSTANEETVVVVMIEHIDAIQEISAIAAIDGVDAILVGCYDLSASMGEPGLFNCDEFYNAKTSIYRACTESSIAFGIHEPLPERDTKEELFYQGMSFIALGMDTATKQGASKK